jgi:hypothetical protein
MSDPVNVLDSLAAEAGLPKPSGEVWLAIRNDGLEGTAIVGRGRNPVGVDFRWGLFTQGSRVAPTLGYGTQPLQGCPESPSQFPRKGVSSPPTSKRLRQIAQGWSEATTLGAVRRHVQPRRGCAIGRHPSGMGNGV